MPPLTALRHVEFVKCRIDIVALNFIHVERAICASATCSLKSLSLSNYDIGQQKTLLELAGRDLVHLDLEHYISDLPALTPHLTHLLLCASIPPGPQIPAGVAQLEVPLHEGDCNWAKVIAEGSVPGLRVFRILNMSIPHTTIKLWQAVAVAELAAQTSLRQIAFLDADENAIDDAWLFALRSMTAEDIANLE